MEHYEINDTWTGTLLERCSVLFAVIFTLEAGAKLYAMYPEAYFSEPVELLRLFLRRHHRSSGSWLAAAARHPCFASCVSRGSSGLSKKLTGLRMLFNTLIISLPGSAEHRRAAVPVVLRVRHPGYEPLRQG